MQDDLIFLPSTELTMLALAMAVLALQYLLKFLLVMPLRPLLSRFALFVTAPLRRGLFAH